MLAVLARICAALTWPFVRYDIRGGRCAREITVAVIAANHRSMFDVVAGLICLHRLGHYPRLLIEKRYVDSGWTGPFARAIGAIPVDRASGPHAALEPALAMLAEGVPVLVMPEGRLYWNPDEPLETGPVRSGVARLAVSADVPVVPVGLWGTPAVLPPKAKVPRFNPFRRKVVVCEVADEPFWLHGDDHAANAELVMGEVRRLLSLAGAR